MLTTWIVLAAGATAIVWVNWYFFLARKTAMGARKGLGGVQEVDVVVDGGYSPAVIQVEAGKPVRLNFDRKEKSACSTNS